MEPHDDPATLTDEDIETRPIGCGAARAGGPATRGADDTGDPTDTTDTGDDTGGDDTGDPTDTTDTGDDTGPIPATRR